MLGSGDAGFLSACPTILYMIPTKEWRGGYIILYYNIIIYLIGFSLRFFSAEVIVAIFFLVAFLLR